MAGFLTSFLREAAARPFKWGEFDCALMIADWVGLVHGQQLAGDLRGAYATEKTCRILLEERGGLLKVVSGLAGQVPLKQSPRPEPGDIGLVRTFSGQIVCAIKVKRGWAVKSLDGLAVADLKTMRAWSV